MTKSQLRVKFYKLEAITDYGPLSSLTENYGNEIESKGLVQFPGRGAFDNINRGR